MSRAAALQESLAVSLLCTLLLGQFAPVTGSSIRSSGTGAWEPNAGGPPDTQPYQWPKGNAIEEMAARIPEPAVATVAHINGDADAAAAEHMSSVDRTTALANASAEQTAAEQAAGPERAPYGVQGQPMQAGPPPGIGGGNMMEAQSTDGIQYGKSYTTNYLCRDKYCIHPVFPGLLNLTTNMLTANSKKTWQCVNHPHIEWQYTGFCGQAVAGYHFAVPAPEEGSLPGAWPNASIRKQEGQAISAYVAHISGMGHDFWDYTEPWKHDDCFKSVWRMVCATHFPKCSAGDPAEYLRPCSSTCQDYVRTCQVECCDEGVSCTFSHMKILEDGTRELEEGYSTHSGPSPLCTGAAAPQAGGLFGGVMLLTAVHLAASALSGAAAA
jgi:hypothetical protein